MALPLKEYVIDDMPIWALSESAAREAKASHYLDNDDEPFDSEGALFDEQLERYQERMLNEHYDGRRHTH